METLSAKVPEDLKERFEKYREDRRLTQSEALRRLLATGLDEEDDDLAVPVWFVIVTWGLMLFSAAAFETPNPLVYGALGLLIAVCGFVYPFVAPEFWGWWRDLRDAGGSTQ